MVRDRLPVTFPSPRSAIHIFLDCPMTTKRTAVASKTAAQHAISAASAAKTGDSLAALIALRDHLAKAIDECGSKRDLAALSRQLSAVLAQIDAALKPGPSKRDEIAARRAQRQADAARRALVEGSDG
jgi:hypothetical protein